MTTAVLIIGAGPTGLTLACDLARRGVAVRIVDKAPAHFTGSRGKGLQPRSIEVFDDLGVVDRVIASGVDHLPFRNLRDGVVVRDVDPYADAVPTPSVPYPCRLIIPQRRVEEILRERLADFGVTVELGTELVAFAQDASGVRAELAGPRGPETVEAEYLVGCDGGHSTVRRQLGLTLAGTTNDAEAMILGDVVVRGLAPDRWYMWARSDGRFVALCPFVADDSWQLQVVVPPDEHGRLPDPTLDTFREIVSDVVADPSITVDSATWTSTYRVNVRMVERYQVGRAFVAGDAAHVHSPAGGLGMNTGLQDAYNLGWKLAMVLAGQANPALLETYQEERLPIAAWTLGFSSRQLERIGAAIPTGGTWPTDVSTEATQLSIEYRWSSLSRTVGERTTLTAGDRAPDAPVHDNRTGAETRLFDLFRGPHFTLLAFGEACDRVLSEVRNRFGSLVHTVLVGESTVDGVADTHGHAAAYHPTGDTLVLVRPDGYIGLIAPPDEHVVLDYLTELGTPAAPLLDTKAVPLTD